MKLHYFRSPHGNFGDDLNAWLWPELLPGVWDDGSDGITFVGVGTILNRLVPQTRLKIVLGSGVGYSPLPANLHDGSWNVLGIRGPLSARAAGLPAKAVITDGAILLGTIDGLVKPDSARTGDVVFVPHVSSTETGAWEDDLRPAWHHLHRPAMGFPPGLCTHRQCQAGAHGGNAWSDRCGYAARAVRSARLVTRDQLVQMDGLDAFDGIALSADPPSGEFAPRCCT